MYGFRVRNRGRRERNVEERIKQGIGAVRTLLSFYSFNISACFLQLQNSLDRFPFFAIHVFSTEVHLATRKLSIWFFGKTTDHVFYNG